jgi:hypothetical protein
MNGAESDGVVTPRNFEKLSLDKTLAGFHRTHAITSNGTYELPFGSNRRFFATAPGVIQRIVERWQLGGLFSWTSGSPLNVTAPISTIWQTATNMTPNIVGDFPEGYWESHEDW